MDVIAMPTTLTVKFVFLAAIDHILAIMVTTSKIMKVKTILCFFSEIVVI